MAKLERKFLSEIGASARADNCFFFKIPDLPHFEGAKFRFDIKKPFDAFACYFGQPIAIEAKVINGFKSVGIKQLRPNQVEGLDKWEKSGGKAFIFLNIRQAPNQLKGLKYENRFLYFPWWQFRAKGTYSKKELLIYPSVSGRNGRYNLSDWLVSLFI